MCSIPTGSHNPSVSSSTESLRLGRRNLVMISHLGCAVFQGLWFSAGVGLCLFPLYIRKKLFWWWLRRHWPLLHSLSRAVVFGFPLGLWPIHSQVLGHLSSECQAWVPSHGVGLTFQSDSGWWLTQLLCQDCASVFYRQVIIIDCRDCSSVDVELSSLKESLPIPWTRVSRGGRLCVSTSSSFLCLMGYEGVIFSSKLSPACGEQPIPLPVA